MFLLSRAHQVHQGVTLYFYPGESNALQVLLGTTTAQDLQVDLGPPIRVHYKEDDRMTIHATNQVEENTTQDCESSRQILKILAQGILSHYTDFMNYFQHGLDFLIDGDTHTVKKILLHTNAVKYSYTPLIAISHHKTVAGVTRLSAI